MADNRYFIIAIPNDDIIEICGLCVGSDEGDIRPSNDGTKGLVKLYEGDTVNHAVLASATEFTHGATRTEMEKPAWVGNSNLL